MIHRYTGIHVHAVFFIFIYFLFFLMHEYGSDSVVVAKEIKTKKPADERVKAA